MISEHIVYYKETEFEPWKIDTDDRLDKMEESAGDFRRFLKVQEKREKRRERIIIAIFLMIIPMCGRVLYEIIKRMITQ